MIHKTIELKLDSILTDKEEQELRYLFNCALSEYTAKRENIVSYVKQRYPDLSEKNFHAKCKEVQGRLELVRLIKNADITVK